ncbi:hypothetical protein [Nocardia sp. NPDC005745]|uniref:hypothetical protein n=1 Tax=Nocardia sp. NPDC005745 TaxID=3157061 RepID=UPI003409D383
MDVSKHAGLSTRQFYEEYNTLEDLLADLHLYVNDLVERRVIEEIEAVECLSHADRLARLVHAYIDAVTRDPRYVRILFVEIVGVGEQLDQQRLQRRSRWIELCVGLFEDALRRGYIEQFDFRLAAAAFIGAINGLMHDWAVGWIDATGEQIADELCRMMAGRLKME